MATESKRRKYEYNNSFFDILLNGGYDDLQAQKEAVQQKIEYFCENEEAKKICWDKIESLITEYETYCIEVDKLQLTKADWNAIKKLVAVVEQRWECNAKPLFEIDNIQKQFEEKIEVYKQNFRNHARLVLEELKRMIKDSEECELVWAMVRFLMEQCGRFEISKIAVETAEDEMSASMAIIDLVMIKRLKVVIDYSLIDFNKTTGKNYSERVQAKEEA